MLSDVALQEFKRLYVEEFGEEISDERAMELGTNLLTLFHYIYHPIKKGWLAVVSDNENSLENPKPNKDEIDRTEI